EAALGGPLALVEDGDPIRIDGTAGTIELRIAEAELARRRAAWRPPPRARRPAAAAPLAPRRTARGSRAYCRNTPPPSDRRIWAPSLMTAPSTGPRRVRWQSIGAEDAYPRRARAPAAAERNSFC